jgi:hypothetical protein
MFKEGEKIHVITQVSTHIYTHNLQTLRVEYHEKLHISFTIS